MIYLKTTYTFVICKLKYWQYSYTNICETCTYVYIIEMILWMCHPSPFIILNLKEKL